MKNGKRPKLPRGLRWDPKDPHIFFSWRDKRGDQHQQSTRTADAAEAFAFQLRFLREKDDAVAQRRAQSADQSRLALSKAAELYFEWKAATNSPGTIEREKRMFRQVEKFVGPKTQLRFVDLELIREYQQQRRKQISPTMRKAVSARSVNYELQLLRGVMQFANCWKGDLDDRYKPLKEVRTRVGRVATKEQLMRIIEKAKKNESWQLAMYCAAVAAGTGCRSWEIKNLQLQDISIDDSRILIRREIAKNRQEREPRLMALAEWGLREPDLTVAELRERLAHDIGVKMSWSMVRLWLGQLGLRLKKSRSTPSSGTRKQTASVAKSSLSTSGQSRRRS
jgi:integrase